MSIDVIKWVLEHSPERLSNRMVLIVLAEHASKDGSGAYPSVGTIAKEAALSDRRVRELLRELEASESIVRAGVSEWGTTIYAVSMTANQVAGAEESSSKGGKNPTGGRKNPTEIVPDSSPKPSLEPSSLEPKKETSTSLSSGTVVLKEQTTRAGGFEEFWAAYVDPNGDSRDSATKAYIAALDRGATHDELMNGLHAYVSFIRAKHASGFKQAYRKPTKWLHESQWKAEYRTGPKPADEVKAKRIMRERSEMRGDERLEAKAKGVGLYSPEANAIVAAVKGAAA